MFETQSVLHISGNNAFYLYQLLTMRPIRQLMTELYELEIKQKLNAANCKIIEKSTENSEIGEAADENG